MNKTSKELAPQNGIMDCSAIPLFLRACLLHPAPLLLSACLIQSPAFFEKTTGPLATFLLLPVSPVQSPESFEDSFPNSQYLHYSAQGPHFYGRPGNIEQPPLRAAESLPHPCLANIQQSILVATELRRRTNRLEFLREFRILARPGSTGPACFQGPF